MGKLCVKTEIVACETHVPETHQIATASNLLPPTTTLSVLLKTTRDFFRKCFHTHSTNVLKGN